MGHGCTECNFFKSFLDCFCGLNLLPRGLMSAKKYFWDGFYVPCGNIEVKCMLCLGQYGQFLAVFGLFWALKDS